MKLHTSLNTQQIYNCLTKMVLAGKITADVHMVQFEYENSRSHPRGFKIQLGTYDKATGPTRSRHYKNAGQRGATSKDNGYDPIWAATYDEWGWFISEIMARDPRARFGHYMNAADFHEKTANKFR